MIGMKGRSRRKTGLGVVAVAALLSVTAACGDSSGGGGPAASDELPDTVKVVSVNAVTGPSGFAGESANKGYELAIKEINDTDFLDGTKLEISYADTKSEPQTAAQEFTKTTTAGDVSAVFGSVASSDAVAMSPLAEKAKMPIIYTQAGSDGVVVGDYT